MVLGSGNVKHMKREAWSELAIKFRRTRRWERLSIGAGSSSSSTRYRKRRKEKKAFMHGAAVKTRIYTND